VQATAVSANLVTCAIGEETGTSIRGPGARGLASLAARRNDRPVWKVRSPLRQAGRLR
jgi:Asp-tRNA(Asn)/Glu-tRNA(Gln) amidotransferase A subunit family amidase